MFVLPLHLQTNTNTNTYNVYVSRLHVRRIPLHASRTKAAGEWFQRAPLALGRVGEYEASLNTARMSSLHARLLIIYFYTLTLTYIIVPSGGRGIAFVSFVDVTVCSIVLSGLRI